MHIVSKFQFFIHIYAMVKLKKTNQELTCAKQVIILNSLRICTIWVYLAFEKKKKVILD